MRWTEGFETGDGRRLKVFCNEDVAVRKMSRGWMFMADYMYIDFHGQRQRCVEPMGQKTENGVCWMNFALAWVKEATEARMVDDGRRYTPSFAQTRLALHLGRDGFGATAVVIFSTDSALGLVGEQRKERLNDSGRRYTPPTAQMLPWAQRP